MPVLMCLFLALMYMATKHEDKRKREREKKDVEMYDVNFLLVNFPVLLTRVASVNYLHAAAEVWLHPAIHLLVHS